MGVTRRMIREAEEAFKAEGMDVQQWAGLLTKMARGYRDIIDRDRWQIARDGIPPKFKPKIAIMEDGPNGETKQVIAIDEATQIRAIRLIGEVLGIVNSGGVQVNVANGNGASAGDGDTASLGVVLIDGSGNKALQDAVAALPASDRRAILEKLLFPTKKEVALAQLSDES